MEAPRAIFDRLATVRGSSEISCAALLRQARDRLSRAALLIVVTAAVDRDLARELRRL